MPGFEIFGDPERREVQDVLTSGVLFRYGFDAMRQNHWKAKTFETEFAQRLGAAHCHLCSSGTAALSIALAACGIGCGDEVVVPPFTFVATVEAILQAGAVPVFAEIDDTLCLDPAGVAAVLGERTRAVMPVHMCGSMARIAELDELCRQRGLILIEDACQAVGGTFQGRFLGTFGKMGCFSFDPVKTITCGEGGAVVTDDPDAYRRAPQFSPPRKLDNILARQRRTQKALRAALESCPAVQWRRVPDPDGDTATFLNFFLPDEDRARRAARDLNAAGVDGCFYWYDNNWHYLRRWDHIRGLKTAARICQSAMGICPDYRLARLPQSDRIMGRTISMQIKLSWTDDQIAQRAAKMAAVLQKI